MKDKIMMLVFVLVLGTILTGILVAVNYYTTPVISRNEQREIQAGILQALGIPFTEGEEQQAFAASVQTRQAGEKTYYVAEGAGIAFAYAGSGLWGPINGIVALNPDLSTLKGSPSSTRRRPPAWAAASRSRPTWTPSGARTSLPG